MVTSVLGNRCPWQQVSLASNWDQHCIASYLRSWLAFMKSFSLIFIFFTVTQSIAWLCNIRKDVWYYLSITTIQGPSNCGLFRQVVLIWRCISTTEVDNEPTYCGLYRQVVFKTGFTVCTHYTILMYVCTHCTIHMYVCIHTYGCTYVHTVYALIFRHSNYSSWAPKGMKSILIDDEIACVLILRQRP